MVIKRLQLMFLIFLLGCTGSNIPSTPTKSEAVTTREANLTPPSILIEKTCLKVVDQFPQKTKLSGKLAIYRDGKDEILDLSNNSLTEFPGSTLYILSPDGNKVAGYNFDENIFIKNIKGEISKTFPWDKKWTEANSSLYSRIMGYETHLISLSWWNSRTLTVAALPKGSQFLLDVETGDIQEVIFPYSDELYQLGPSYEPRNEFVLFSPTLESVVYATTSAHFVMREFGGARNTIVWARYVGSEWVVPAWSFDGDLLAMPINNDLYVVDKLGQDKQVADLQEMFEHPYSIAIRQIGWSPNSQKIAMNVSVKQSEDSQNVYRLLVFDLSTEQIIDYCTPDPNSTSFGPDALGDFGIMWSPDGRYIATETSIVDLEARKVYRIPDIYINQWVGEGKTR